MEHTTHGWIEVVAGPMFGGKSEELIRRLRRATIAKQRVQVFKPEIDTRYSVKNVASHAKSEFPATPISTHAPERVLDLVEPDTSVVGLDEVQFMGRDIVTVCRVLADRGVRVIAAGLNQTSTGEPFGPIPHLMAIADEVTVLTAICTVCGSLATKTMRLVSSGSTVEVGETDKYEARCRKHFVPVQ